VRVLLFCHVPEAGVVQGLGENGLEQAYFDLSALNELCDKLKGFGGGKPFEERKGLFFLGEGQYGLVFD
jgi:IS4 transposase